MLRSRVALVLLIELYPAMTALCVSLFANIVLTTFALHKQIMESRIRQLEQQASAVPIQMNMLNAELQDIVRRYNGLVETYNQLLSEKQSLNRRKPEGSITR